MLTDAAYLSIVSDSTARVRVSAPYIDASYEAAGTRDGSWDTTGIVTPGRPFSLTLFLSPLSWKTMDSVRYNRRWFVTVTADAEVSAIVRTLGPELNFDASVVWPAAEWDTEYLYHGSLGYSLLRVQTGDAGAVVQFDHSVELFMLFNPNYPYPIPVGTIQVQLPPDGAVRFDMGYDAYGFYNFSHWNPVNGTERDSTVDGAGDLIRSDQPFMLLHYNFGKIYPSMPFGPRYDPYYEPQCLIQPSRRQMGTEYVFVPFRKPGARTQDDFVRIIAEEDDTDISLFEGTPALHLKRAEHVDTLIDRATVIRATRPVAVYQHHLTWMFLETDTTYYGGALPLLPHGLWGKRYYPVDDDGSHIPPFNPDYFSKGYNAFRYYAHYYILITKAAKRDGIFIDDVPVDASRFTVFGDWAYAYVDVPAGFHVVRSDHSFLTISCGGMDGSPQRTRYYGGCGISYIPPFR